MVEVCGALLHCVHDAGVTMRLLAAEDGAQPARWEPAGWYPLSELESLQASILRHCTPGPVLDRLGEEMVGIWYRRHGEQHRRAQLAEVLCARVGPASAYSSLVRGDSAPQGFALTAMDDEQGVATVCSSTIFSPELERGMLRASLNACRDLLFFEVRSRGNDKQYTIYFVDQHNQQSLSWAPPRNEHEWRLLHWRRRFDARESFECSVNKALQTTAAELHSTHQVLLLKDKLANLGTLAAAVSHEMNNPTTFAHAGAQLLVGRLEHFRTFLMNITGDDAEPAVTAALNDQINDLAQQVKVVLEGTTRVAKLLKDFRSMARPDAEHKRPAAVFESLQSTISLVRTQYAEKVDIACDLEGNPMLTCWPGQLGQVFMNLIVNACQAIEKKQRQQSDATQTGHIHIRCACQDHWLRMEFSDDGCGIPAALIGSIFDPFVTTKRTSDGSGLGLSISAGIITRHGGTLRAYSEEHVGSRFVIELPLD